MYAVVIRNSFDPEVLVILEKNEQKAVAKLRSLVKEEAAETENLGFDSEMYLSDDGWYGKITTFFADHEDFTEYNIGVVRG